MHRAALAVAEPVLAREEFEHHRRGVAALCDAVTVPAMCAPDIVLVIEMHANTDRRSLLAGVEMHEARNPTGLEFVANAFFEDADHPHQPVGLHQIISTKLHQRCPPT